MSETIFDMMSRPPTRSEQYWLHYVRNTGKAHFVRQKFLDKGLHYLAESWFQEYIELAQYWYKKYRATVA